MDVQRKHLIVGLIPVGIAVMFLLAFSMDTRTGARGAHLTADVPPERARLLDLLGSFRRAWRPTERAAVLAEIRAGKDTLEEPMRWLFAQDGHEYMPEASTVAGDLSLTEFCQRLTWLAQQGPPRVRPHALLAAAKLGAWDPTELEELLQDEDPAVQVAALQTCAITETRPWTAMVPLLSSEHAEVREAAVAAFSTPLTEEEREVFLSVALDQSGPAQAAAVRILRGSAARPDVQATLVRLSFSEDPQVARTALESLAAGSGPLPQPEEIWNLAVDSRLPLEHRAEAVLCLERTRSAMVDRVRREMLYLGPEMRYFAGRYLMAMGEREGAAVLVDLVDELQYGSPGLDQKVAASLSHETRRTLALASGLPMETSVDELRGWYERTESLEPQSLPVPAVYLGPSPAEAPTPAGR